MNPVTFEKDDDTNYDMDLIAGLANMRARNYSVPEVDKLTGRRQRGLTSAGTELSAAPRNLKATWSSYLRRLSAVVKRKPGTKAGSRSDDGALPGLLKLQCTFRFRSTSSRTGKVWKNIPPNWAGLSV